MVALAALAAGIAIALLVSSPDRDDLDRAAQALAPEGTRLTRVLRNTGNRVIVGDYFTRVEFDETLGRSVDGVLDAAGAKAETQGWEVVRNDRGLELVRGALRADVDVRQADGSSVGLIYGSVEVRAYSLRRRLVPATLALAAVIVAVVVVRAATLLSRARSAP